MCSARFMCSARIDKQLFQSRTVGKHGANMGFHDRFDRENFRENLNSQRKIGDRAIQEVILLIE